MTSDQAYRLLQFITNKTQEGYVSPDQFNLIINEAQMGFLNWLLGQFQSYQYGRPQPKVQWGMNEIVRQRLTVLIDAPTTLTIDSTGLAPYPSNFQQVDAMYTTSLNRIRFVPQHKLYSYLNSQIDPVASNPIFLIESDGFRFYPITTGSALLSFVKTPPTIVWAYTLDVNQRPVYNPALSVGLAWYETDCFEIVSRALRMAGVNLDAAHVSQYADEITKEGQ